MKTNLPVITWLLFVTTNSFPQQVSWPNMVRITYNTDANRYIDDIVVRFSDNPSVTTGESAFWDARTLNCCDFIASLKGNTSFAIQTRPLNFNRDTVRLRLVSSTQGRFRLLFSEFNNFLSARSIILTDAFTGMQQDIRLSASYAFSVTGDPASQGVDRFKLVFVAEPIVIKCPDNISTSNAPGMNGAYVNFSPVVTGRCSRINLQYSRIPGSFFNIGTTPVTLLATDSCGNASEKHFTVTVNDTEAPVIGTVYPLLLSTAPGSCTSNDAPAIPFAADNSGNVTLTATRSDGAPLNDPFKKGVTTLTWTVSDPSGNTTVAEQVITVADKEAPRLFAPARLRYEPNHPGCSFKVNDNSLDPQYSDNCSDVTIINDLTHTGSLAGAILPAGKSSITWTATDGAGNTITLTTVVDVVSGLNATVPDTMALPAGVRRNTLYAGYTPAAVLAYKAIPAIGTYQYAWSAGNGIIIDGDRNAAIVRVIPSGTGNEGVLGLTVTDSLGCSFTMGKNVHIVDVRCDSKANRVQVCSPAGRAECIGGNAVKNLLNAGYQLGSCSQVVAKKMASAQEAIKPFVTLYPNPANEKCIMMLEGFAPGRAEIQVRDALGRTIIRSWIDLAPRTKFDIDLRNKPAGVYDIRFITKEGVESKKLVLVP